MVSRVNTSVLAGDKIYGSVMTIMSISHEHAHIHTHILGTCLYKCVYVFMYATVWCVIHT